MQVDTDTDGVSTTTYLQVEVLEGDGVLLQEVVGVLWHEGHTEETAEVASALPGGNLKGETLYRHWCS